ncbi:hypothetical protein C7271_06010 [filamentous cyanobacterium CCP5]|nr:hypothetical protein C7271_06010 [filamentous cyanobacterium CCP5]
MLHHQVSTRGAITVLVYMLLQGCTDTTVQYYGPITLPIDERNELHISTYPADFPDQEAHIPFLYRRLRTPDQVYFQVFVREKGKEAGHNPNIESIEIRSFSYQFPSQEPTKLISDCDDNFWMQDQPNCNPSGSEPIPFNEHWYLQVQIDMTVNGVDYRFDERIDANTRRSFRPLILWALQ